MSEKLSELRGTGKSDDNHNRMLDRILEQKKSIKGKLMISDKM